MSAYLQVDQLRLKSNSPAVSLTVMPGQLIGVFGAAASGKSWFINSISGASKPLEGKIKRHVEIAIPGLESRERKLSPQVIAKRIAGREGALRAGEAIEALRLWNERQLPIQELSKTQQQACELLPVLCSNHKLLMIDGQLDGLDAWMQEKIWDLLRVRTAEGCSVLFSSHQADWLQWTSSNLIFKDLQIAFAGNFEELRRNFGKSEILIESTDQPDVRAYLEPFEYQMTQTPNGWRIQCAEGQQVAANLLLKGYGDTRTLVLREPTPTELLKSVG